MKLKSFCSVSEPDKHLLVRGLELGSFTGAPKLEMILPSTYRQNFSPECCLAIRASRIKGKLDARKAFFFPGFSENWSVLDGDRIKDQPNYCSLNACSPDAK